MTTNFRKSFWYGGIILSLLPLAACSNENSTMGEPETLSIGQRNGEADQKGYYYEGDILLTKANSGEKIYEITLPMMYPVLYGYTIPIPLPDYESSVIVKMGEGTVIEQNSVKITTGGKDVIMDMPAEGTLEYCQGLSITRISSDEYEVRMDPSGYLNSYGGYDDVKIMMRPIPHSAFDDSAEATDRWFKFETAADFGLSEEIPLHFVPFTFTDSYRPIRQYHMRVF